VLRDRKLIQSVRRGWEYNAMLAVRWGANPAVRDERGRSLLRIFLEDHETYRPGKSGLTPYCFANFALFLLCGLRVPVDQEEFRMCVDICRERAYNECAEELLLLERSFSSTEPDKASFA
jgi:hypothetical protein